MDGGGPIRPRPQAGALIAVTSLGGQRFAQRDGQPRLAGPALEHPVRDCMQAERAENTEGLSAASVQPLATADLRTYAVEMNRTAWRRGW